MNKKLERYRQLRDKKKARLEKAQKDMDRLEQMVQDEENTQIVAAHAGGTGSLFEGTSHDRGFCF